MLVALDFYARKAARQVKGQGLVEYALILVLIAIVVIVVVGVLGTQISTVFSRITSSL